jgi:hypothetical protein
MSGLPLSRRHPAPGRSLGRKLKEVIMSRLEGKVVVISDPMPLFPRLCSGWRIPTNSPAPRSSSRRTTARL